MGKIPPSTSMPQLTSMLRTALIGYQFYKRARLFEKRLLALIWMMEAFHHKELAVKCIVYLVQYRTGHRHSGVFEQRIPARPVLCLGIPSQPFK